MVRRRAFEMTERMARSRAGRVALHLGAFLRDWRLRWHLRGIRREIWA